MRYSKATAGVTKPDMTPMIDIVFQLIIFFLVVTEMAAKDLADVTLPRAEQSTADDNPPSDRLIINVRKDGRIYKYVLRDKLVPEDPYLVLVKAGAFARLTGEAYNGTPPDRAVRDFLVKSNVII